MKKIFSLPFNNRILTTDGEKNKFYSFLHRNKEWIYDIYYSVPVEPFTSDARGDQHMSHLKEQVMYEIKYIKDTFGIDGCLTLNNSTMDTRPDNMRLFIKNFREMYDQGVRSITLPVAAWASFFKREYPDVKIRNSVVTPLSHPQEMVHYVEESGYNMLYLREDMVKDRGLMKQFFKTRDIACKDLELGMLVDNEACIHYCPLKKDHYAAMNHVKTAEEVKCVGDYLFRNFCTEKEECDLPSWYKRTYVFPIRDHFDWFVDNFDFLKFTGRTILQDLWDAMEIIDTYTQTKKKTLLQSWFKRLIRDMKDIQEMSNFFDKHLTCKSYCATCGFCDEHIKKSIHSNG